MPKDFSELVKRGLDKGFLTYTEVNQWLEDDALASDLKRLLAMMDERGIALFSEDHPPTELEKVVEEMKRRWRVDIDDKKGKRGDV